MRQKLAFSPNLPQDPGAMVNEHTGEKLTLPEDAHGLVVGRRVEEGMLIQIDGVQVFVFVHEIRSNRVALRMVAPKDVYFGRVKGFPPPAPSPI